MNNTKIKGIKDETAPSKQAIQDPEGKRAKLARNQLETKDLNLKLKKKPKRYKAYFDLYV